MYMATQTNYVHLSTVKVHLTPKLFFSLKRIHLLFKALGRKNFWIWLNPQFFMPFQSHAWSAAWPRFRESGAAVADDIYPGTKHNSASVSSLYLLEKVDTKLIVPKYFGTKTAKFCFRTISFSSLESELSFNSEESEINFDWARLTTVNLQSA